MNPTIAPAVAERAVQWLVELQSPQATELTHAQWRQWLEEHPSHQQAWERIESFSQRLASMRSGSQNTLLYATLAPRLSRRRALQSLAVLVATGSVAWTAKDSPWAWQWRSDYRSGVGQQRQITLADGTFVLLNTDTSLDVNYGPQLRLITLHSGEIMLSCAQDSLNRPLAVDTGHGRCTTMSPTQGLRLSVRQSSASTLVSACNGPLTLAPAMASASLLEQGCSAWFDRFAVHPVGPVQERDLAWTHGMVVADNQRLEDFLANLARYRQGHLACDRSVADLRISGTYPLADTDLVLATVSKTLHLDIRRFTRYWTTLSSHSRNA